MKQLEIINKISTSSKYIKIVGPNIIRPSEVYLIKDKDVFRSDPNVATDDGLITIPIKENLIILKDTTVGAIKMHNHVGDYPFRKITFTEFKDLEFISEQEYKEAINKYNKIFNLI